MPPVQLAIPLAVLVGAAIAAASDPAPTMQPTHAGADEMHAQHLDGHAGMQMLRITIGPGAMLPQHRHMLPDAGYLIEGELQLETADGETLVMKPGDTVAERRHVVRYGAAGPQGATILVFYRGDGMSATS